MVLATTARDGQSSTPPPSGGVASEDANAANPHRNGRNGHRGRGGGRGRGAGRARGRGGNNGNRGNGAPQRLAEEYQRGADENEGLARQLHEEVRHGEENRRELARLELELVRTKRELELVEQRTREDVVARIERLRVTWGTTTFGAGSYALCTGVVALAALYLGRNTESVPKKSLSGFAVASFVAASSLGLVSGRKFRVCFDGHYNHEHPDLRADEIAQRDLKHTPKYGYVTVGQSSGLWWETKRMLVSYEALSQVATASTLRPDADVATTWERIYQSARTLQSVNIDRYLVLSGDTVVQNTCLVALGMWHQMRNEYSRHAVMLLEPGPSFRPDPASSPK